MADSEGRKASFSGSLNNKLSVNKGDLCLNCDELCSELHKAQLELLSYEKSYKCASRINKELGTSSISRLHISK